MSNQTNINTYFKTNQCDAIQKEFLRQCQEIDCSEATNKVELLWPPEKTRLENEIQSLHREKDEIATKYEKLKKKHIELLQTLLNLELKNQEMELKIQKSAEAEKKHANVNENANIAEPAAAAGFSCFEMDLLAELVSIL